MARAAVFVVLTLLFPLLVVAQELNCDVTVNVEQVPSASRDYLRNFESDVEKYLNDYRWTNEDLGGEKINCTMNIFFKDAGDNRYTAQVFVGSRRTVYKGLEKTDKETVLLRVLDGSWQFDYVPNKPLYHDEFQFDPLADFLDFYANLIIGFDFDTYTELSGSPYFQKALNICNQAAGTAYSKEWTQPDLNYSRFSMVDELTNLKYQPFRLAFYKYHFEGIDLLATEPTKGLDAMLSAIETIGNIKQKQNPNSVLVKTFFNTKYQEIAEAFLRYPDRSVYRRLSAADPDHQSTYVEFSAK